MSVDKIIKDFKTYKLYKKCLKFHTAPCKATFKCDICHKLYNTLIHFNVSKSQIETSNTTLFSKDESASICMTKSSNEVQSGAKVTSLTSNLKDKHSTGLL